MSSKAFRSRPESARGYRSRPETEYERLKSLSANAAVSEDLRTYFLLKLSSISMTEHEDILG
eukprot:6550010-Pyramimonas_sp.AAC.1